MTQVRAAFRQQAKACASLGSPLMQHLMTGLADQLAPGDPVADRVLGWQGDPSSKADSVPLRLAGGLHSLVLTGRDPALAAAYATDSDPTSAALDAIRAHPAFLLDWLNSPPQTNEVRRSAPLIAAALDLAAECRPKVDLADAADWLEARLAAPTPGALHIVFHTVARQYFPHATQARAQAAMQAAMQAAGKAGPVARLSMEADGQSPGAALTLTLWPGGDTIPLGRADFHGRWVDWQAP